MKNNLVLLLVAIAGALAPLIPSGASAHVPPACVVVDGPAGLHLQLGYAPNGPDDCTQLP